MEHSTHVWLSHSRCSRCWFRWRDERVGGTLCTLLAICTKRAAFSLGSLSLFRHAVCACLCVHTTVFPMHTHNTHSYSRATRATSTENPNAIHTSTLGAQHPRRRRIFRAGAALPLRRWQRTNEFTFVFTCLPTPPHAAHSRRAPLKAAQHTQTRVYIYTIRTNAHSTT